MAMKSRARERESRRGPRARTACVRAEALPHSDRCPCIGRRRERSERRPFPVRSRPRRGRDLVSPRTLRRRGCAARLLTCTPRPHGRTRAFPSLALAKRRPAWICAQNSSWPSRVKASAALAARPAVTADDGVVPLRIPSRLSRRVRHRARLYRLAAGRSQGQLLLDATGGFVQRAPELQGALAPREWDVAAARTGSTLEIPPADQASTRGSCRTS